MTARPAAPVHPQAPEAPEAPEAPNAPAATAEASRVLFHYVWPAGADGKARDAYAHFRRAFAVTGAARAATVRLHADTSYQLWVNGEFVGFGPARFDPRFPLYDEYDLAPRLRPGENVIAVTVNHCGAKTYKAIPARGGFALEGALVDDAGRADLGTGAEGWRCLPAPEHSVYAPKISFALATQEIVSAEREPAGWRRPGFDARGWAAPVAVEGAPWGAAAPRGIPFMRLTPLAPAAPATVLPLANHDDVYSFAVPFPDFYEDAPALEPFVAFASWVWSPRAQSVPLRGFWGELWLDGAPLPGGLPDPCRCFSLTWVLKLREGWNHLFGKVGAYGDVLAQLYSVPAAAGLEFCAGRRRGDPCAFRHSRPQSKAAFPGNLGRRALPFAPDDDLADAGGWVAVPREAQAEAPWRWTAWDEYGAPREEIPPSALAGKTFRRADYPDGFCLRLDLGATALFLPRLRLRGARGARVDLCGAERLLPDARYGMATFQCQIGDRVIAGERDEIDFLPLQPRGARYLWLTVRGAREDVTFEELTLLDARYPARRRGSFACSDKTLNAVWEICARTQETNMEDAYVDCVTRERGLYTLDTLIQYRNNLALFGDQALMRRCLELYLQSNAPGNGQFRAVYPNGGNYTIATFSLYVPVMLADFCRRAGERDLPARHWEALAKNLTSFRALAAEHPGRLLRNVARPAPGSAAARAGRFCGDDAVVPNRDGLCCEYSCAYLAACRAMAELAGLAGRPEAAAPYAAEAATLERSIPETFYDPGLGAFRNYEDTTAGEATAQPTCLAIWAGACPAPALPRARAFLRQKIDGAFVNGCNPSGGVRHTLAYTYFVLEGLYAAGEAATAERLLRSGWGWLAAIGKVTTPEYHDSEAFSHCHAWSASPVYFLSREVGGVRLPGAAAPGVVRLRPQAAGIDWARVTVPAPQGDITVAWHRENGAIVYDEITVPEGMRVEK